VGVDAEYPRNALPRAREWSKKLGMKIVYDKTSTVLGGYQFTPIMTSLGPLLNGIVNYDFWAPEPTMMVPGIKEFFAEYQKRAREAGVDTLGYYLRARDRHVRDVPGPATPWRPLTMSRDPYLGWQHLAEGIDVEVVPGVGLEEPRVAVLAERLREHLDPARAEPEAVRAHWPGSRPLPPRGARRSSRRRPAWPRPATGARPSARRRPRWRTPRRGRSHSTSVSAAARRRRG
jgi:hypothetical protein